MRSIDYLYMFVRIHIHIHICTYASHFELKERRSVPYEDLPTSLARVSRLTLDGSRKVEAKALSLCSSITLTSLARIASFADDNCPVRLSFLIPSLNPSLSATIVVACEAVGTTRDIIISKDAWTRALHSCAPRHISAKMIYGYEAIIKLVEAIKLAATVYS